MIIDETGRYKSFVNCYEHETEYDKYYYLYEYTDNIQLITNNSQYPNILNYVKTGLLTEEEMIQALLYK